MVDKNQVIKIDNVSKSFKLPHEKNTSVKSLFVNFYKRNRSYETQQVLLDVSFEVKSGEFFGIIGRNGSGKSTLLKMMAGTYSPSNGTVDINGKLTPFIELGVGFNPELTGRENVFLNGALLGFDRKDMLAMYNDIVDFAELERFMDQKLKNYSSGMQVRLAFSIAIRAQSDILLLDEVLAVGDEAFQRKCYDYFESLRRDNKTVVIVTHDMSAVERFCTRAILIEEGRIIKEGSPEIVARAYSDILNPRATAAQNDMEDAQKKRFGDKRLKIDRLKLDVTDPDKYGSEIILSASVSAHADINKKVLAIYTVKDGAGQKLFGDEVTARQLSNIKSGETVDISFSFPNVLYEGKYFLDVSIYIPDENIFTDSWIDCKKFNTNIKGGMHGYSVIVKNKFNEVKI